jgi:predicted nucleic acid-binding protein
VIVVSDTSPLNYLVLIDVVDVLRSIFTQVYIPPSVIIELTRSKTPELVRRWADSPPDWLTVVAPSDRLPSTASLGEGEADALSLAKELHIVDVLIDDRRGRKIAIREGLVPLPTLAILERAAADNLLDLRLTLDKLKRTNMRVPADQIEAALQRDAARKHR